MSELVPCHVEHAYARRTTDMYSGADHVVLDGPLEHGRLRRDLGDALCKPARTFRDLEPTNDRRDPSCVTCLAHLERLVAAGVLERPSGGRRTRTLPCLAWTTTYADPDGPLCGRCSHPFDAHTRHARLHGWLKLNTGRAGHGLGPLPAPPCVRSELEAAAASSSHPHHGAPLLASLLADTHG